MSDLENIIQRGLKSGSIKTMADYETRTVKTGLVNIIHAKRAAMISFAAGTIWGISLCYLILEVLS